MTTLKTLRIQNVRSVGNEAQVIEFLKPLTIIQGPNGTGKTTTIECLNYVTNGALPAGKMHCFIHNNKLLKKKKVDALVQLEFINFHGLTCTATKRMTASLSPKTSKITTKSEEFTLAIRGPNGLQTMSSKVADFNREMQNHLGVSNAILNNVIFCHQEESTWPLSEPKELKLRFDAIFEVTKYVKAMDGLKKSVKEWESELKLVLTEIPYLVQTNQDRAALCLAREDCIKKISVLQEEIGDGLRETREIENELREVRTESEKVTKMENQAALIDLEIKSLKESVYGLNVEPYPGPVEELQKKIDESTKSSQMMSIADKRERTKQDQVQFTLKLNQLNADADKIQKSLNMAEANEMMFNNYKAECNEMTEQAREKFGIQGNDAHFIAGLDKNLKELEYDLRNFDSLQNSDRQKLVDKLSEAKKVSHENELMHNLKIREEKSLSMVVNKSETSLNEITEKIERLSSSKNHLKVRLNKMTQRERIDIGVVSNQLHALENEASVLTDLASNDVDIDELVEGVEGLSVDHERAFEKLSVRFLANRLRRSVNIDDTVAEENGLKTIQTEVEDLKTRLKELQGMQFIYKKWGSSIDETGDCPLCEKICSATDVQKLKKRLNIVELSNEVANLKEKLSEAQKKEMNLIFKQRVKYVNDEIRITKEKIEKESDVARMEIDLKRQIEDVERALLQANGEMATLKSDLGEKKILLADIQSELELIRGRRDDIKNNLDKSQKNLDELEHTCQIQRNKISAQIGERKTALDSLKRIYQKLADQKNLNIDKDELEQQMVKLKNEVDSITRSLNDCVIVLSNCDTEESQHRVLEDQMRLFKARDQIRSLKMEREKLEFDKKPSLQELSKKDVSLNKKALTLRSQINQKEGRLSEMQSKLKDIGLKLKSDVMKTVKTKLYQKVTEKMVYKGAIDDLVKFSKVLDDSIIAFHHQKMSEINRILSDLWPRVYQGSDIETIRIKSQTAAENEKRKSYDYSVVMVVDQEEIEMRDRCSAGQKVLASILIRIALADVFGGNCPILALDEPTTNLDASKVENMGTMLKDLLDVVNAADDPCFRSDLQLLVITHDRRLVDYLTLSCRPDFVYVLSKDELGMSHINKKNSLCTGY